MPVEQYSDEVREIIGKSPSWMLRSGLVVILAVILLLLCGSWLFHYPDLISARIEVLSENPPAPIVARTTGRIDHLFVKDNEAVSKGQLMAMLENTASLHDVMQLKKDLVSSGSFFVSFDTTVYKPITTDYNLGDIQSDYSSFLRLYNNYISFVQLNYYPLKIASLKKQVRMQSVYCDRLGNQLEILEREFKITNEQFQRDSLLYLREVLSLTDYKNSESSLLSKKFDFQEVRTDLAEAQRDMVGMEQEEIGAAKEFQDQKQKLQTELTEAFNILRSRLEYWEKTFVLQAPIDGKVTFTDFWSKNQQVKTGDVVFTVVPEVQRTIIGRVTLPSKGAGKVKPGQRVNIRFDNFPYMEFGMVKGTVKSVSLVPSGDNYIVEVDLPQDLNTNYNIPLSFSQEMKGDVEIVTDDLRLIHRFFNPVKSVLKDRVMRNGE